MQNILIVGAGVNGLTLASKLVDKFNVTVLEKEEKVGLHSSQTGEIVSGKDNSNQHQSGNS